MNRIWLLGVLLALCLLTACRPLGEEKSAEEILGSIPQATQTEENAGNVPAPLLTFSGITGVNTSVVYDGQEHAPTFSGVPSFATVTYAEAPAVHVGTYTYLATVSAAGYENFSVSATVSVLPETFAHVTFPDKTVKADGSVHALAVEGLPSGATVIYLGEDGLPFAGADAVGTYLITAILTHPDYVTKTLTATLILEAN